MYKKSSVHAGSQIWVALQNARFLLIFTNLAFKRLQINIVLLLVVTSTADELFKGYKY